MNIFSGKPIRLLTTLFSMLVSIAMLNACGSSGGGSDTTAGIGGTGIAVGKVTDFGSIFVNGNIFDINQAQFLVDGEEKAGQAGQDDLSIGMVVLVKAETNNGVFTGKALEVFYDDEVEGPVAATPVDVPASNGTQKTFTIFGQTITIDETGTIFEGTTFAGLDADDVVEISGFRTSDTTIDATYVEFKGTLLPGTTEVELRGTIQNLAGVPPNETFQVDGINIATNAMTVLDVPGNVLVENLFVEVEGIIQANLSVIADEVEFEDEDLGDDVSDVSLQGVINNYMMGPPETFEIDGQPIDASGAQIEPFGTTLENGLEVEVEGDIVGGVLIAEEIEIREGETKLKAFVDTVSSNSFTVSYFGGLGTVVIKVDAQTTFEDEKGLTPLEDLELSDLIPGVDFVKIEGKEMVNNEVIAGTVKRIDDDDYKLQGAVDGFIPLASITVLGIIYPVDDTPVTGTEFEGFANAADFFTALDAEFTAGNDPEVEIEDDILADGIADKVELE
jgi:hypothetical protein